MTIQHSSKQLQKGRCGDTVEGYPEPALQQKTEERRLIKDIYADEEDGCSDIICGSNSQFNNELIADELITLDIRTFISVIS